MSLLWAWALKNPLLSGMSVLLLAATITLGIFDLRIDHLKTKVATRDARIVSLSAQVDAFRQSVARQDAAITQLQTDAKKRQTTAAAAIAAAKKADLERQTEIDQVVNIVSSGNDCADADLMINKYIGSAHK